MSTRDFKIEELNCIVHPIKYLGKGKFGSVYQATSLLDRQPIIVKKLEYLTPGHDGKDIDLSDIKHILSVKGNSNVLQYFDVYDDGKALWLSMEYCDLGDLEHYLLQYQKHPSLKIKVDLMLQCAKGLNFIHWAFPLPIAHGDIKLKAFLVKKQSEKHLVKISDYGTTDFFESIIDNASGGSSFFSLTTLQAGGPPFKAPEQFNQVPDGADKINLCAADVFSLGLVFQVLLYYPDLCDNFLPQTVAGDDIMPIGMAMNFAKSNGLSLPDVVKMERIDSQIVQKIKRVIQDMTKYDVDKRIELPSVETELEKLFQML